ncbi:MAG TPA: sensor histidine kinase [Gemmatimonadaceae bacterium]|nr:sensor histidine kinase [Gemmatimonadaceae bacterium]
MTAAGPHVDHLRVLVASASDQPRLRRAFARLGHHASVVRFDGAVAAVNDGIEAVVIAAPRVDALTLASRLKTRFQVPFLPVVALVMRPTRLPHDAAIPDAWVTASAPPREVVERVEELVRIRRAERELVRLNGALTELAAENGRLYDRARRDAEATTLLLRELQHRVRNNLASIQALLILERHRTPPRALSEAIDVAIARLRSMAALQDALVPTANQVDLASLAHAIARSAVEVFGATGSVQYQVKGGAALPPATGSAVAIVLNELVTNALKHAMARELVIDIRSNPQGIELIVADDGCGMPHTPAQGSGLAIARAVTRNELRGELRFVNGSPGTRIHLAIPSP